MACRAQRTDDFDGRESNLYSLLSRLSLSLSLSLSLLWRRTHCVYVTYNPITNHKSRLSPFFHESFSPSLITFDDDGASAVSILWDKLLLCVWYRTLCDDCHDDSGIVAEQDDEYVQQGNG
jgi:hypothetical protein